MSLKQDIRPVTYLKTRAADLLNQINETQRPLIITQNGKPRGVPQTPEGYEKMNNSLCLLKLLVQGEDDIRKGRVISQDKVFTRIGKRSGRFRWPQEFGRYTL